MLAILIVGDEILRAQDQELNSFYITKQLHSIGQQVNEIRIVSDDVDMIAATLTQLCVHYEYVISTGGIGPTHDDVTMQGAAKAFRVRLVLNEQMEKLLCDHYPQSHWDSVRKMAMLPEGSSIVLNKPSHWPVIRKDNLFLLPGLPSLLREKMEVIKELLPSLPIRWQGALFLDVAEHHIAQKLMELQSTTMHVQIGSYPVTDNDKWTVRLTFVAIKEDEVQAVFTQACTLFKNYIVIKQIPTVLQ